MDKQVLWELLGKLKAELQALYGERLERVLLFGSQARGDATPESDVDVLVVLRGVVSNRTEMRRTLLLRARLSLQYGTLMSCIFFSQEQFEQAQHNVLQGARTDMREVS